jgi:hypothetical protein
VTFSEKMGPSALLGSPTVHGFPAKRIGHI